eukprot:m.214220 g.214220  ORF g.214220 m.214220 type:complete len:335 (+) comp33171_c0_seq8:213-1217(+)
MAKNLTYDEGIKERLGLLELRSLIGEIGTSRKSYMRAYTLVHLVIVSNVSPEETRHHERALSAQMCNIPTWFMQSSEIDRLVASLLWQLALRARTKVLFATYESHIITKCVDCLGEIVAHPNPTHGYHEVFTSFLHVVKTTGRVFAYMSRIVVTRMREAGCTQVIDLEDIAMLLWRDIVLRRLVSMRRNGQSLLHGLRMDDTASLPVDKLEEELSRRQHVFWQYDSKGNRQQLVQRKNEQEIQTFLIDTETTFVINPLINPFWTKSDHQHCCQQTRQVVAIILTIGTSGRGPLSNVNVASNMHIWFLVASFLVSGRPRYQRVNPVIITFINRTF